MKKLLISLVLTLVVMGFFHLVGSFALGGIATGIGFPFNYFYRHYETGETFSSTWYLIANFFIWFGVVYGIICLVTKKV